MKTLHTQDEVLKALGGTCAVASLTGKSAASISNAKRRGWFPRDSHAVMSKKLAELELSAPASLWQQVAPSQERGL